MLKLFTIAAAGAALLAAGAAAQTPLAESTPVSGQLEDSDRSGAGEEAVVEDRYTLRLEAGRRYRISAASEEFDTVIRLFQAGDPDPVAENDDFDIMENLNSRITYVPEESDEYRLHVFSYTPEGRGRYEVRLEPLPPLPPPVTAAAGARGQSAWQIWEGALEDSDPDRDGIRFDDYLVTMRAGETRLISAESDAFDPIIWVLRADEREGEPLDIDDDAGPGTNALLGFQAEDDGRYLVRVTAFGSGGEGGAYRLRISDPVTPPLPLPSADTSAE